MLSQHHHAVGGLVRNRDKSRFVETIYIDLKTSDLRNCNSNVNAFTHFNKGNNPEFSSGTKTLPGAVYLAEAVGG